MALNIGPSRGFNPRMNPRPVGPAQRPMGMAGPSMGGGMGGDFIRPGRTRPPFVQPGRDRPLPVPPNPGMDMPITPFPGVPSGGINPNPGPIGGIPPDMSPPNPPRIPRDFPPYGGGGDVGPVIAGPIDTGPREVPLPVGPPVMGPPDYTNPYQTQVPDMAMQQNIGQNIRKTGGLRSAYGGSAAGLTGGPFRRQMFY